MSIFPVAPDNSMFPVPVSQQRLFPNASQLRVDTQNVQSGVSRIPTYQNDNHEVLLSRSQRHHAGRHAKVQQRNALDNWTNGLMGRSRR